MVKISKITLNNFTGGINNDFAKGSASAFGTKTGSYYFGTLNPNIPNYLGQLGYVVGENPNYVSSNNLIINGTKNFNSSGNNSNAGYFAMTDGSIGYYDNFDGSWPATVLNYYTAPAGAVSNSYKDIWSHVSNATTNPLATIGSNAVLYTYETATNAYLGIAPVTNFAAGRNDIALTFTNRNVPHVGVLSAYNISYITDKNYLRAYTPLNASPFTTSINCGLGYTLVSVADYGNYCAVVGNNGSQARMWLWDGTAPDANFQYDIRDTNVTAIVNEGGDLRVFTYGKNGTTKIKTFNGSGFSEEADWETPTSLCPAPLHNMVDVFMNQIVWKTPDGYLWSYGSPRKNELGTGAHRWGKVTSGANTSGMVKNLYQNQLFIASNTGSQTYLFQVKADESYATSSAMSNFKTNLIKLPHYSTIERVTVYFSKYLVTGSGFGGSSLTASLYRDYDTTTDLLNYSIPTGDTVTTGTTLYYHPIRRSIPNIDTFYLNINYNFAIIREIEITYSYDDNII